MLKVASILTALAAILVSSDAGAVPVQIESTGATTTNSRTLEEIHLKQRRHVLFNSRQLTGQCLDLCPTRKPTQSPTTDPTAKPTANPTNDPTESPTNDPTESPTDDPTDSPTADPTAKPTANPTKFPTGSPTDDPTADPTAKPTANPTKFPTGSPTDDPTAKPTANPTCKEKKAIDVCLVLDNSGSICSIDKPRLCTDCDGGNQCKADGATSDSSCCGNNKKLEEFAIKYIESLDGEGTFSVVQYASRASTIAEQGNSNDAIDAINDSTYMGGWTNTEAAIFECIQQLKDIENPVNPVIVLITDGVPTACRSSVDKEYVVCNNDETCDDCKHDSAKGGAVKMANIASKKGMSLVPVVIQTVNKGKQWNEDKKWLSNLARCPKDDDGECDVDEYKALEVGIHDVGDILGSLIRMTECA